MHSTMVMNLRCRGPDGQVTLSGTVCITYAHTMYKRLPFATNTASGCPLISSRTAGLDPAMTAAAFQQELAHRLGVPPLNQELLAGFPPKLLQVTEAAPLLDQGLLVLHCDTTCNIDFTPADTAKFHRGEHSGTRLSNRRHSCCEACCICYPQQCTTDCRRSFTTRSCCGQQ